MRPLHVMPPTLAFGHEICGELEQALRREWLVTNGLGGFAAGTIAGCQTRRYHDLLIAAERPPVARIQDRDYELACHEYGSGVIHPAGHRQLEAFHLDGTVPTWTYAIGPACLTNRVFMARRRNTTYICYMAGAFELLLNDGDTVNVTATIESQPESAAAALLELRRHDAELLDTVSADQPQWNRQDIVAGGSIQIRLRLSRGHLPGPFAGFDEMFITRRREANAYYAELQRGIASEDARSVQRQAFAGVLWSQQHYYLDIPQWLRGDPTQPPPPEQRRRGRNGKTGRGVGASHQTGWTGLVAKLLMPRRQAT
jgi:hypothetical protein